MAGLTLPDTLSWLVFRGPGRSPEVMVVVGGPPRDPSRDSEAAPTSSLQPQGSGGTREMANLQPKSGSTSWYLGARLERLISCRKQETPSA